MKIVLDYDPTAGHITAENEGMSFTWMGLERFELKNQTANTTIEDLVKLRNAGYETDDIIELRKKEII